MRMGDRNAKSVSKLGGTPSEPTDRRTELVFLLIFALLAAGVITAGFLNYQTYKRHYRDEVERQLSAIAELKVRELEQWRTERLADAGLVFANASFGRLVQAFFAKPEDTDAQRELRDWMGSLLSSKQLNEIRLLDTQGVTRLSVPVEPGPVPSNTLQQAATVLASGQVAFQDFYRDDHDQRAYLAVLVPILDGSTAHRKLGVLVLRIDPSAYLYPFIQRWPTSSRTAETLLARREGSEVVFLNALRFQTNAALNFRSSLDHVQMPAVQAALGREGIMDGVDYRGVPVVAALRTVPDSPWSLVARMDTAEVYAPLRERFWQVMVLVAGLLFGAGAGVGLVWRQQRLRFYRNQVKAAEALRDSEERYRSLFENMMNGFAYCRAIFDGDRLQDFVYVAVNRMFEVQTGLKNVVGKPVSEVIPGIREADPQLFEVYGRVTRTGVPERFELYVKTLQLWFDIALYSPDRNHFVAVFDVITERKRAEAAREEAYKALAHKTDEMESLLYASSHDLRTPLVNIQGFSQRLEKATADLASLLSGQTDGELLRAAMAPIVHERMPAALSRVLASTARMDGLISGLLRLSRLTRAELTPERLDMDRLVRSVIDTMEYQLRLAGAEAHVDRLPACHGEAAQLGQVVSNLIDNALKYRDPRRPLRVRISGEAHTTEAVYCVEDNGVGIKPEYQERIWNVFVRLDPQGTAPGEGLGLTVIRRIVERHGGRAWVDSVPGRGSRFLFSIPVSRSPE